MIGGSNFAVLLLLLRVVAVNAVLLLLSGELAARNQRRWVLFFKSLAWRGLLGGWRFVGVSVG